MIEEKDRYKDIRPVNILGNRFYTWETPVLYAVSLLLILIGACMCFTTPTPVSGWLSNVTATNVTTPSASVIATNVSGAQAALGSIGEPVGRAAFESRPFGVALQLFMGALIGVFGLTVMFIAELVHTKERANRLKDHIDRLEAEGRAPAAEDKA